MTGLLFALGATTIWGMANVWIRLALRDMRPTTVAVFSLCSGLVLLIPLVVLFYRDSVLNIAAGALFTIFIYGMSNFLLGRFLNYSSISRIGLNRSVPIIATSPVAALVLAVVFLGEGVDAIIAVGTATVMAGVLLIVTERR